MTSKTTRILLATFFSGILAAQAQLSIPGDGSDGAFNPATNVEIDLGLATTTAWNNSGTGNGVYDASKWAVVFKYTSVNIPAGVKVTFKNHPSYAPVVWLVQGNVTIAGELNLDGKAGVAGTLASLVPAEPGPGGFRGGAIGPNGSGLGYGPGGADGNTRNIGQYASVYGNPQIIPLIGGSGGRSVPAGSNPAGSGAGGAILIAAAGNAAVSGLITAAPGSVANGNALGSGGAVRLIASNVTGSGQIICLTNGSSNLGRIRIESPSLAASLLTFPETIGVPPANPPVIWPAENAPTARVVSVDAVNAPVDPHARLVAGADVAIQNNNQVNILIETANFPIEGVVQLNITRKFGTRTTHNATRLSGDITAAIWQVQTVIPQGFVTLQARATQP